MEIGISSVKNNAAIAFVEDITSLNINFPYSFNLLGVTKEILAVHTKSYGNTNERDAALQSVINYANYTEYTENISGTSGSYTFALKGKDDRVLLESTQHYADEPSAIIAFKAMVELARDKKNFHPLASFRFEVKGGETEAIARPPDNYKFISENERDAAIELIVSYLRNDPVQYTIENVGGSFYSEISDNRNNLLLKGEVLSSSKIKAEKELEILTRFASNPEYYKTVENANTLCAHTFYVQNEQGIILASHPSNYHDIEKLHKAQLDTLTWVTDYTKLKESVIIACKRRHLTDIKNKTLLLIDEEFLNNSGYQVFKNLALDASNYSIIFKDKNYMLALHDQHNYYIAKHPRYFNNENEAIIYAEEIRKSLQEGEEYLTEEYTETYYYELKDFSGKILLSSKVNKEFENREEAEASYNECIERALKPSNYEPWLRYKNIDPENKKCTYSFYINHHAGGDKLFGHFTEYASQQERDDTVQTIVNLLKTKHYKAEIQGTCCGFIYSLDFFYSGINNGSSKDRPQLKVSVEGALHYPSDDEARKAANYLADLMKQAENYKIPEKGTDVKWLITDNKDQVHARGKSKVAAKEIKEYLINYLSDESSDIPYTLLLQKPSHQYQLKEKDETFLTSVVEKNEEDPAKSLEAICERSDKIAELGQIESCYGKISSINSCLRGFELFERNGKCLAVHDKLYFSSKDRDSSLLKIRMLLNSEGMHLIEHLLLRPQNAKGEQLLPMSLLCQGNTELCAEISDPYSFRITIVIPFWPERFNNPEFREFMENTLKSEAPAHILPRICWLNTCQMSAFEKAYNRWLKTLEIKNSHCDALNARNALIDVIKQLRSNYPEAQLFSCGNTNINNNIVVLNHTRLG
jgi:hypothetical protein